MAEGDVVAAQGLQRQIGIGHLVVGVGIEKLDRLVVEHLAQQRGDRFALGEPLPAQAGQFLGRLRLVERDEAGHPAIGEIQVIEGVENPRPGQVGKAEDGQRAQMRLAQHRLDAAGERGVHQQAVEIERRLRHGDRMAPRRNRPVQVGQGLGVIQPPHLRHEAGQQVEHPVGLRPEPRQILPPVSSLGVWPFPSRPVSSRAFSARAT